MKVLVLFSGGLDSTTCLAQAVNMYGAENVIAVSMLYGQKHDKELWCAKKIADYYKVKLLKYDLAKIFEYSNCSLLEGSLEDVPDGSYAEQLDNDSKKPVSTYVPFRNGLFISTAASLALSLGCERIYYAIHKDDAAGSAYPDCSQEFNKAMQDAIYEGTGKQVTLVAPFVGMDKGEIVWLGTKLKVPYELTWSCYKGNEKACGKCGTCIDRLKAFKVNGLEDPIDYE